MEKTIELSIVTTSEGRALEYDGEQFPLPMLPFDATVHAYQTPAGLWAGAQAPGDPRPVYAGSGGVKLGTIAMDADAGAVLNQKRASMVVTMRQARRALLQLGLLDQVQIVIDQLPEPEKSEATVDWQTGQYVERNWIFVVALGPALGLSESDIDGAFELATTFKS